jgi:hypothetical protein
MIHRIAAAAANANHFNYGILKLCIHNFEHYLSLP